MSIIRGNRTDISDNIVVLGTLTSQTSTPSYEVDAIYFTFVHDVTGSVTIVDEGSLDGEKWFSLDEETVHSQAGVDAHFYFPRYVRYIRSRVTAINNNESVTITVACT